MRVSISGPPGSGKTTICMMVAEKLDCDYVLVGQIFRQMARERRVDLAAFGRLAEEDETIDKELDDRMAVIAMSSSDLVIEGRLAGAILKLKRIPVFAVFVTADEKVRGERIAGREKTNLDPVLREMRVRERSEKKRYMAYYGIDPYDKSIYDMWIDTSNMTAEEAAEAVAARVRNADAENARQVEEAD